MDEAGHDTEQLTRQRPAMKQSKPRHCRARAYELFAEQVRDLRAPDSLWKAAVAVSMHQYPHCRLEDVDHDLQELADRIQSRAPSGNPHALLAHGHDILFEEEGFAGNSEDYYNPDNSYLPMVMETRLGLPITLSLVYKCVLERVGLQVEGINAPGHFLAEVRLDGGFMLVDPFFQGRVLNREEAFRRMEEMNATTLPRSDRLLARASHHNWLARMIRNLQAIFQNEKRSDDFAAMLELQEVLASL